jgi:hypothetical protein
MNSGSNSQFCRSAGDPFSGSANRFSVAVDSRRYMRCDLRAIPGCWLRIFVLSLALQPIFFLSGAPLPKRIVIALDGIAYRDMVALQKGVDYLDDKGRPVHRRAFTGGYFPVSRLISTFPSASDVAWTEIFGSRALPGYQRTYFSLAANREIFVNGVTSSVVYEKQMTWRMESRFHFAISYIWPLKEFRYELDGMVEDFLHASHTGENYYALILSTDSAQHMAEDILAMLCALDERLQVLRAAYRAREGRELEILILSDHGNNHAGRGQRVQVIKFLKKAGYRIAQSLVQPQDVVLPTVGMESWVEVHNAPSETERLVELLSHLKGVDLVTGRLREVGNSFLVMNSQGERATIEWNPARNTFRYACAAGDPLQYVPVLDALRRKGQLDADGFAPSDVWMTETLTRRYPVALERVVQAHTRGTLNPATILISLANGHLHAGWLVAAGSKLMKVKGTHGALDDLNSTGILLSNFGPTQDTTAGRVATLYEGFPGLRDPCVQEEGAEWISGAGQATITVSRGPLDWARHRLPDGDVFLHVWSPQFGSGNPDAKVQVAVGKVRPGSAPTLGRWDPKPPEARERRFWLSFPVCVPDCTSYERVYPRPVDLTLEPQQEYCMIGCLQNGNKNLRLFRFSFWTDNRGRPVAY